MSQLVSEHYGYNTSHTVLFSKTYGEDTRRCPHKGFPSLFPCLQLLVEDTIHLSPSHVLGQIGTPWFTAGTLETLRKAVSVMKR
jgi:hypothetical protein